MRILKISIFSFLSFVFSIYLLAGDTYGGRGGCDGILVKDTIKASGHLLVALGFGYCAIGFIEVGEPQKVDIVRELTEPISKANEAAQLFQSFAEADLPTNLNDLDILVRQTDYKTMYDEFIGKGLFVPKNIWDEVSSKALQGGIRGLMGL